MQEAVEGGSTWDTWIQDRQSYGGQGQEQLQLGPQGWLTVRQDYPCSPWLEA